MTNCTTEPSQPGTPPGPPCVAPVCAEAIAALDPFAIDDGGPAARLEDDAAADTALRHALARHGQLVPILVRPHPGRAGRYQIIAGRRRVLALRDLGQPVLALVRPLDDVGCVLAQGQENTARRDLSFIEKAQFARQLADAGYTRHVICDALSVNKTLVSRMLAVADAIPPAVIAAIGAAPAVGRERWTALMHVMAERAPDPDMVLGYLAVVGHTSDARFDALLAMLERAPGLQAAARARPVPVRGAEGLPIGSVTRGKRRVTLSLRPAAARGFEDWLVENLAHLHGTWLAQTAPGAAETAAKSAQSLQL